MKAPIVTGFKPSGTLHVGNYLGAVKNAIDLQNSGKYECFFFVADYHAITQNYDPKEKRAEITNLTTDLLAAGIDPKKTIFFVQSHVPAHANLSWIFGTITSTGRLGNMIEYKEKVQEGHTPNLGLFSYPVLMAADILLYKPKFVPVGEDQRQHLEIARDIARAFNTRFGKTFPEPQALYTQIPRVMSLDDPKKKMSKSRPNGCLYLSDKPEVIRDKVKRAVTDSENTIAYDPEKRPGVSNLVLIFSELSGLPKEEVVVLYKDAGYAKFKEALANVVIEHFEPFRERRKAIVKDKAKVASILETGRKKAVKRAAETMAIVHKKVGLA